MVKTSAPSTAEAGSTQERVGEPFTCTVQAPHCAAPQPNLVPLRSRTSLNTHRSGMSGGTSTLTRLVFTVKEIFMAASLGL
jgi:hypothetical protein